MSKLNRLATLDSATFVEYVEISIIAAVITSLFRGWQVCLFAVFFLCAVSIMRVGIAVLANLIIRLSQKH